MGDDPYDFEIAIPSGGARRAGAGGGGGGNAKSYGSRRYGGDSSDDSNVDVSNSDRSEEEGEDSPVKAITKQPKQSTQSASASRSTASTGGGGSSSALDKAKSFLSKYSTKSVDTKQSNMQASSRSSRRVELSLDDSMNFSSDDEEDDDDDNMSSRKSKKHAVSSTVKLTPAPTKRVQLSDSEDYGGDSDDDMSRKSALKINRGAAKQESESDDEDDASEARGNKIELVQKEVAAPVEEYADDAEEEEEVASFMDESDEDDPPPFSAAVASKASASDGAKRSLVVQPISPYMEDSEDRESSTAAKSDNVESLEDEDVEPSSTKPVVAALTTQAIAASESGVYGDEGFDEESEVVAVVQPPLSQLEDSSKTAEPAYDYSMDFSDDNVANEEKPEAPPTAALSANPIRVTPMDLVREQEIAPTSTANSHDGNNGQEESDYLESDDDRSIIENSPGAPSSDKKLDLSVAHSSEATAVNVVKSLVLHSEPERRDGRGIDDRNACDATSDLKLLLVPSAVQHESLSVAAARTIPSSQQPKVHAMIHSSGPPDTPTTRGRILIVREYEQPRRENVEMKDASTQFTGNHAGIQADLTPDGMHSIQPSSLPSVPAAPAPSSPPEYHIPSDPCRPQDTGDACDPHLASGIPSSPVPPPAPLLGLTGYTMDLLRLPTATTTSIYKQQLLALQEHILVKKRETERLVHERMAFQYSSLRGTERFLTSNRPGKLELWQALMRVDPTLTERKAREIARLTMENAAA